MAYGRASTMWRRPPRLRHASLGWYTRSSRHTGQSSTAKGDVFNMEDLTTEAEVETEALQVLLGEGKLRGGEDDAEANDVAINAAEKPHALRRLRRSA
uniref:Uncharacterized protein n=1 Tax=Oryza punctata TaxID=4537 RepID=A0A0E0MHC4_ORYPU